MGWRVSWYKADKNQPLLIKHHAKEEYGDEWDEIDINGECLINNSGTEFWIDLKHNKDFKDEIKCLKEHPDIDYYSITKDGFKQIILSYRQRIIDYMKASIDLYEHPEEKESRKHWFTEDVVDLMRDELREWEYSYENNDGSTHYFCIDLSDNKNRVSGSWKYKYGIFDMISVYKNFDWENDLMVVFGG